MEARSLDFDHEDFGPDALELMTAGIPFTFHVTGAAQQALAPHLSGREIPEPIQMATDKFLQPLLALLMVAEGCGRAVSIEPSSTSIRFSVGFGQA